MPPSIPVIGLTSFAVPKEGSRAEEYEDYCGAARKLGRFAIADGASESSFAKEWAQLLVKHFLEEPVRDVHHWQTWLPPLQKTWCDQIDQMKLSWFAREKADIGAFATFLGFQLANAGTWQAVAIGDCCLFQVRRNHLETRFPLNRSTEFTTTPALLGVRLPSADIAENAKECRCAGTWLPGDQFYLATDALAQLFLQLVEGEKKITSNCNPFVAANLEEFTSRIEHLRKECILRNDDVTLMKITITAHRQDSPRRPAHGLAASE